ncbi:MAG: thiamine pyrophosphate-dependent enzyme [Polyangiaceae bacterium]|nr:thiamine pyrophosphate-dependent enzyme [Polyangiaceae bacterium]
MNPATDPDVGLFTVLREDGSVDPERDPKIPNTILLEAYRHMRRLRRLDERMILLQRQGRIGFYGPSTGQEAVPIAAGLVARESDWVFPAFREHSIMLVRGFPLRTFLAQVFGNAGDVLKGRQMPSHQAGRAVKQASWSSCVGSQLPHAVGVAWAMKLRHDPSCTFGFLGDGATSTPDFHAAMNFAAVMHVPAVLVCQNNQFAISLPVSLQTASATLAVKGRAYGMRAERVDGNDFVALYTILAEAADRARRGQGPTFVEAVTYRVGAHSTSDDPSRYREQAEVDAWKNKDPILRLACHLRRLNVVTDESEAKLDNELESEIAAAVAEVEALPGPARESLFDDVYATLPWHLREQRDALMALPPPK